MNKYHIHVYSIKQKAEIDLMADNEYKARELALKLAKENKLKFTESDTPFIAIDLL